ncbi:tripartite tricarboxylate transporter TctB family protein [Pseudomonas sp. M30-35]|uniref:tripartite tricarboxylate transporter TctB family protein n=1 Tax=Pseudomonas sp. M30-35 TaxID=1981174 RepID=UPI000B3C2B39|nr:tripartite tricarboxylate transporter TctB family protein [Pseudomonas sp. M30-35]ARU90713.1 hypothetical protein B9K09_12690 [Pseudomonas sp. M30-35]
MNRRKIDVMMSSILILSSLVILTSDRLVDGGMETDLGSMFLPRIVACFIIALALMIGCSSLYKMISHASLAQAEVISFTGMLGILCYVGLLLIYWFSMPYVGFIISTSVVMFAVSWLLQGRNIVVILLLSIILPLVVYYGSSSLLRLELPVWSIT